MKKTKLTALLSAALMGLSMAAVPAKAAYDPNYSINLTNEALMSDQEKQIREYCDIILCLVNNERMSRGLSELYTFPLLSEATCVRANELCLLFEHTRPDGDTCFGALKAARISYGMAGENIAAGASDPVSTVNQWMASPQHRANILSKSFSHMGGGYDYYPDDPGKPPEQPSYYHFWSQFFIGAWNGDIPKTFDGQYIPDRSYGDADGSHEINAADAQLILKYAASHAAGVKFDPPTGFIDAADINKDGSVDAIDAAIILEYATDLGAGKGGNLSDYVW